jgi:hypothetical protein
MVVGYLGVWKAWMTVLPSHGRIGILISLSGVLIFQQYPLAVEIILQSAPGPLQSQRQSSPLFSREGS